VNVGAGPILLNDKTSTPMSTSPPREPPDVIVSSPPTPRVALMASTSEPTTEISLEELSRRQHEDQATAAASITLVSDRKGKGKAHVVHPIDELENYDLQEDADAVRMEPTHEQDVFRDDNGAVDYTEDSEDVSSGNGAYPPIGDDDLEERRVTEVRTIVYSIIRPLCLHSIFIHAFSAFSHTNWRPLLSLLWLNTDS
jgi:hypothetical protein